MKCKLIGFYNKFYNEKCQLCNNFENTKRLTTVYNCEVNHNELVENNRYSLSWKSAHIVLSLLFRKCSLFGFGKKKRVKLYKPWILYIKGSKISLCFFRAKIGQTIYSYRKTQLNNNLAQQKMKRFCFCCCCDYM